MRFSTGCGRGVAVITRAVGSGVGDGVLVPRAINVASLAVATAASTCAASPGADEPGAAQAAIKAPASSPGISVRMPRTIARRCMAEALAALGSCGCNCVVLLCQAPLAHIVFVAIAFPHLVAVAYVDCGAISV